MRPSTIALLVLAGCIGGPATDAAVPLAGSANMGPDDFFEINVQIQAGSDVHWDWAVDQGLNASFNIHRHTATGIEYLVEEHAENHTGTFHAEDSEAVSLMWESESPVMLSYRIWGNFTVDSGAG